ncbi:MAG: hypothetical protein JW870_10340 [Candidatus Delongbacteria bacterium]|nr:hypothetical protein [Candidatus Delongbacteria bacterium]
MNQKKKTTVERKELFIPIIILIVGSFLTFFAPSILTMPSIRQFWNFTETGNIGDTIGGITSPIIGLMGASLMFYSIILQYNANKRQDKAILNQSHSVILQDLFRQIYDSYNDVNNSSHEQSIELDRLAELADNPKPNPDVNNIAKKFLNYINYITTQFEILFKMLDVEDLKTNDFPLLNLQKEKAIRLLNLFIDTSKARIVFGSGTFILNSDGITEIPISHLLNIKDIIEKWDGKYMEIQLLSSYLSLLSKGDIKLSSMEEVE